MGMRYRKDSAFEKPEKEAPRTCGDCPYFTKKKEWKGFNGETNWTGICSANGCYEVCRSYEKVNDNCKLSSTCYWWYMNRLWNKISKENREANREERRHIILLWRVRDTLTRTELKELVSHKHRPGGGGLIDFNVWPQFLPMYKQICEEEGIDVADFDAAHENDPSADCKGG